MSYEEYKKDLLERLRSDSTIRGTYTEDEFLDHAIELLTNYNEIQDNVERLGMGDKKGRGGRIMKADGYCFDEIEHSIIFFISDFYDTHTPPKLTMPRLDELYWRMYYLLDEICNGWIHNYFDDSDDILMHADLIRKRLNADLTDDDLILKIKFYIITNSEIDTKLFSSDLLESKSTKKIKKRDFNDKPLEIKIWDTEKFFNMEESNSNEPVEINFNTDFPASDFKGIPFIKGNIGENLGYNAYIAIIPGKILADIYIEHGSKVLEGNIRAFLGTSNSKGINAGIKKTINKEPEKFFTYNNGIAATAKDVTIKNIGGESLITNIVDFQIINGGQTTATLAEAVLKKYNKELNGIYVPMKLTVIEDRGTENEEGVCFYDEMVQAIAKYANSQNKVTSADFFSNDPFHIWMEKQSKKILTPPNTRTNIQTGWFYERSRKKYLQDQFKFNGDRQKIIKFTAKFPKKQIITKEQLAMYKSALDCKPHIVSKGKDYAIKEFGSIIKKEFQNNKAVFNEFFFKKCICAAIIFRTIDEYLESNKDSAKRPTGFWYKAGGHKLNIIPYTIAKIISSIPAGLSLDWKKIWNNQSLSHAFMHEIEIVTKQTNDFICDSKGVLVTQYCKKESTWEKYQADKQYQPSLSFLNELVSIKTVEEEEKLAQSLTHKNIIETKKIEKFCSLIKLLYNEDSLFWEKVLEKTKYIQTTYKVSEILKFIIKYKESFPNTIPDLYNKFDKSDINKLNKAIENLKNIGLL